MSTRTIEPTQITTGERIQWIKTYADYPATLWQLNYYFRGPGTGFNAAWGTAVTADGTTFEIDVPAATTDDMSAGQYTWQAVVTEIADSTNKILVGEGRVAVKVGFNVDPTNLAPVETRSPAKIMVDTIDAALLAFAASDIQEYEITTPAGSRRVKRGDKENLLSQRKYYAAIVAAEATRERGKNGGPAIRRATVTFYEV
jgi:hypothetical protein